LTFEPSISYLLAMAKGIWQRAAARLGARKGGDEVVARVEGVLPGEAATARAAHDGLVLFYRHHGPPPAGFPTENSDTRRDSVHRPWAYSPKCLEEEAFSEVS
jgi:hypothetical protein